MKELQRGDEVYAFTKGGLIPAKVEFMRPETVLGPMADGTIRTLPPFVSLDNGVEVHPSKIVKKEALDEFLEVAPQAIPQIIDMLAELFYWDDQLARVKIEELLK